MVQRATYKKHVNRKRYDLLNINIDEKWLDFDAFFDDMYESYRDHVKKFGERSTTLDRIDNSKGYNKKNCKWRTPKDQARNRKSNIVFTVNGKTACLAEHIDGLDIKYSTVWARLKNGWTVEDAINKPVTKK